jgi:hypothetical protein
MKRETIEKIFNFLKTNESKEIPESWSIVEKLETHPDGIQYKYDGNLVLINRNITKLPNDLYVDGNLILDRCGELEVLPDELFVLGYLSLYGCKQLTKLPDDLHLSQSLIMIGTSIEEIPDNLNVGWNLFIGNTPLANKYTDEEIYEMIKLRGGKIINDIIRL